MVLLLLLCVLSQAVEVVLHEAAGQQVQLRAYLHALQLATTLHQVGHAVQRNHVMALNSCGIRQADERGMLCGHICSIYNVYSTPACTFLI
jgi:hypothetical protein